jgi:predicted DNA-binding antitoxin AbrB/MazE fold protein
MAHTTTRPVDQRQETEPAPVVERRIRLPHLGKAETLILRDNDTMRVGLAVRLVTIRAAGLGVVSPVSLRQGEQVKIRLRNDVQRITAELRGAVRNIVERDDGYAIEIELFARLMPLDVMALRRAGATDIVLPEKIWV